jgi:ClpP class serine protease
VDLSTLFFILILFTTLQPIIRRWLLDSSRTRLIRRLEDTRGSRVIALVHRQETISFLGLPLARYIDIEDSEAVLRAIRLTDPDTQLDLILHTPGGLVLAAEQIASALCRHRAKVTVIVPHYAMSGGTLIALAADEIIMDENAVLGPVDPQVGGYAASSILKVVRQKPVEDIQDETLSLADTAAKAIGQVRHTVKQLVMQHRSEEEADRLADLLSSGTWTHDYPISVSELRAFGLNVSTDVPREVYALMSLFPQTSQRRPSVEYVPGPSRRPAGSDRPKLPG